MDKQLNKEEKKQGVRSDVGTLTTAHSISKDKPMKPGAESLSWGYDMKMLSKYVLQLFDFFFLKFLIHF